MEIDGKRLAKDILADVTVVANVMQKRVCFIQFDIDEVSSQFIARKQRAALSLGVHADVVQEVVSTTEDALAVLEDVVSQGYDGIVVQLPLPPFIDTDTVLAAIPVAADIDMLTKESIALFEQGLTERMPPVAGALNAIIVDAQIDVLTTRIVLVGNGRLVGAPIAMLFDRSNIAYETITVTTPDEERCALLKHADIVISGTGIAHSITPDMVRDGVILIDAGASIKGEKIVGDIDPACFDKAQIYTPVPGGVGPITVAILFKNLFS